MNFSLTTFNKTGKLMQIENALARVNQGKMSLGIRGTLYIKLSILSVAVITRILIYL